MSSKQNAGIKKNYYSFYYTNLFFSNIFFSGWNLKYFIFLKKLLRAILQIYAKIQKKKKLFYRDTFQLGLKERRESKILYRRIHKLRESFKEIGT